MSTMKTTTMKNTIKLVILVVLLGKSTAATRKEIQGSEDGDDHANKSVDDHFFARIYNEKQRPGSPSLGGAEVARSAKDTLSHRDFFRRNYENKSNPDKRPVGKWRPKEGREEDYFRKASRDALIGKAATGDEEPRKDKDLDEKVLAGQEEGGVRAFRNDESYAPQRNPVDDTGDYLATNRQRKIKKHGGSGYIPLPPPKERKPNIILILTDDQDVELGSLNFMPKTLRLLRDGGAEFRHAYVTTPMCCPSRSSLLTGMYVHNHNVYTNNENCSNIQWQQTHETRTFATYLSNAGYRTGYFGKYLNKYNGSYIPPGWREWGGLIMNSRYYNYSINLNGKKIKHGFDYHKDYYPDLIANDSVAFLRQSKQYFSRKPVMLVLSFPAPHGPEDSAPQYSKMFFNITTHHTPAYDFAPNPDKQWILQVTNKMQDIHKQFTDVLMTKRLQTLQSVDVAVERIYQELKTIGELENTYIIYTSDHGYHLGQFGLVKGKSFPFEFDVRVPFLVRGPGIEPGTVVDDIVLNIDLAPTFLDIAGVESPLHMDGRSIVRLLHHRPSKRRRMKWPDTFLIESSGRREIHDPNVGAKKLRVEKVRSKEGRLTKEKGTATKGLDGDPQFSAGVGGSDNQRTAGGIISVDSSETESVDEVEEEENSEEDNGSLSFGQDLLNRELPIINGQDMQVDNKIPPIAPPITRPVPKSARLALECQNPDMQSPCQPGQKWHCVTDGDRWRKYKCKFQKKCTCYTPSGFVYTRLYSEDKSGISKLIFGGDDRRSKFTGRLRRKRRQSDFDLWSRVPDSVDHSALFSLITRSIKVMRRRKRDTAESHISDVLDDLEHELVEAEETEILMNATISIGQEPNISKCSVTALGKVNCSSLVYSDFKVWKKSRDQVEAKITSLKAELEALKEIRKHLREKRPEFPTTVGEVLNATDAAFSTTSPASEDPKNETHGDNSTTESLTVFFKEENQSEISFPATRKHLTETPVTIPSTVGGERFSYSATSLDKGTEAPTTMEPESKVGHKPKNQSRFNSNEDGSANKIHGVTTINRGRDTCVCRIDGQDMMTKKEEKELAKEAKRKLKEERLRKKERKLKKKAKLEKECLSEKMNCFIHDNEHWRTPPLWTEGPFCFCMNANNNTYSCLRTINATHNFLYCEFTTGFRTFYNLRIDPFEQLNRFSTLTPDESRFLSNQLADLKACKGTKECTTGTGRENLSFAGTHHHHHHHPYTPRVKAEFTF